MTTTKTFMFTSHRPQSLGGFGENELNEWVQAALRLACARLRSRGFRRAISGMALGTDPWGAEAAMDAGLRVVAAVPCRDQQSVWPLESQTRYLRLLRQCSEVEYVHDEPYVRGCLQERNSWMLDRAELMVAVWDGLRSGGTWDTVSKVRARGVPVWVKRTEEAVIGALIPDGDEDDADGQDAPAAQPGRISTACCPRASDVRAGERNLAASIGPEKQLTPAL